LWHGRTSSGREKWLGLRGSEKLRNRLPLDAADAVADLPHFSGFEDRQDRLPRHLPKRSRQRCAHGVVLAMASRTARLKKSFGTLPESRGGSDDEN
jgi:hypothetical protein